MKVTLKMDAADKILLKRSLNKNGKAQVFFTHEIRRLSDPYVPFQSGRLKNDAVESVNKITYNKPYARRQWYENKGGNNGPLRGNKWCLRMWADRGKEIVKSVANFAGGRSG